MLVSAGTVLVSLLVGGYVILPLDALLAQMSGHFRSELLDARVTDVVKQLAASLDRRRRGTRRFATEEQAVLHIQRAFRERKKRNLGRAAKLALMHAASGKMADRGRAGGAEMCAWTSGKTCDRGQETRRVGCMTIVIARAS